MVYVIVLKTTWLPCAAEPFPPQKASCVCNVYYNIFQTAKWFAMKITRTIKHIATFWNGLEHGHCSPYDRKQFFPRSPICESFK